MCLAAIGWLWLIYALMAISSLEIIPYGYTVSIGGIVQHSKGKDLFPFVVKMRLGSISRSRDDAELGFNFCSIRVQLG